MADDTDDTPYQAPEDAEAPTATGSSGNSYLAAQRAPFAQELNSDSELKGALAAIVSKENPQAGTGVVESLFNRTAMMRDQGHNVTLAHMMGDDDPYNSFYGPVRRGELLGEYQWLQQNPKEMAARMANIDEALQGSNYIQGNTDQGSKGDPNYDAGGTGVNWNGERFNDWGGAPGSAAWRMNQQRQAGAGDMAGPHAGATINTLASTLDPAAAAVALQQRNDAYSQLDKAMGPVGGGAFDHQPLPPAQRSPQPAPLSDAYSALDNAMRQDQQAQTKQGGAQQPQPTGYDWGTLGSAFTTIPRDLFRGFVEKLGLPADIANWTAQYYQTHPHDAALLGSMGEDGGMGLDAGDYLRQKLGQDPLPAYEPNSGGYRLPLGTQDIGKAIKYATGLAGETPGWDEINNPTPYENTGQEVIGHMAQFVGAGSSPRQLLHDLPGAAAWAASKTKSLAGLLFHHVLAPAGMSGGLDLGEWGVDKATGNQELGEAVGIGARALLGGAAIAGLARGGRATSEYIQNTPQKAVDQAFEAAHNSNAPFEKVAAAANLENWTGAGLPEGYETPAAIRTGSAPLQQMFFNLQKDDMRTHNDFVVPGGRADRNISAMEGMRPEGDAQDAVQAVRNAQSTRQSMIDTRIQQAKDAADQAGQIASKSSSGAPLVAGGPQGQTSAFDLANAYVEQLRGARDDAFAHAEDQWDVARQQGFTSASAPTKPMYSALEGLIGQNVRLQQGANFPYDIVSDLYKDGNPRGMFDKLGVRAPKTIGQNQLFEDGPTTLEQLKGVDSRLGNAIRMEQDAISSPGNRGNPTLLRNLMQVRNVVWKAIDDGAVDAGNQVALRSAMDATAQAYHTFGNGIIARVLNERGGTTNAPALLRTYLGNSQNAIQAADMFKSAMAQRTGAAAARMNVGIDGSPGPAGATPQQQFSQTLADWMRQDYLNARADGGVSMGQRWLVNHGGFFDRMTGNPDFDTLHSELMGYSHVRDELLPQVQGAAKRDQAMIDNSAAQHFLGGDAGPKLDAVFKDQNPGAAMKGIVQDTLQDSTGQAFRGLERMAFDRMMNEAMTNDPVRPNQTYYSGKLAQKFLTDNKVAFDALRQADPQWSTNLDRMVQTMALEDRGRLTSNLQLPPLASPGKSGWSAAGSLATKSVQYLAAHLIGRNLPAAGLQGEALSSQFGREAAQNLPGQLAGMINKVDPMNAARNALREAMFDPEKLRGLLAPVTGPSGQKWARGVEPWLQSVGVMLPQGWLNPQPQDQGNGPP